MRTEVDPHDPPHGVSPIGQWLSRAVFLLDTNDFNAGGSPIVFATMLYEFRDDRRSLVSEGVVPNLGFHAQRAIVGGTGAFAGARGEVRHDNIGFNSTGCFNYRFTFHLSD